MREKVNFTKKPDPKIEISGADGSPILAEAAKKMMEHVPSGWECILFLTKSVKQADSTSIRQLHASTCEIGKSVNMLINFLLAVTKDSGASLELLIEHIEEKAKEEFGF